MNNLLAEEAGSALFWKVLQQGAINLLYLFRLIILARLLAPDDFGLVAIALTGVSLFVRLTDFGLQPALVQKDSVTNDHYSVAWTIGVLRALIVTAAVFVAAPLIATAFGEPRSVPIVRALALMPLLEAVSSIKMVELTRKLRFRSLGIAKVTDALTNTLVCIFLAPALGVWALVVGTLAGPFAYLVLSYVMAPHRPRLTLDRRAAAALIRYGRWIFVTGLVSITAAAVLRAVISRELGTAELGLYFLAAKLAFLPNEVATEVIGGVSFPVYARVQARVGQATKAFRAILLSTYLVLTPVFALLITLGPSLVEHVLGQRWKGTEALIPLLALAGLIGLIGDATVPVLNGLGQPGKFAALEAGQSLLLVAVAWVLLGRFGLVGAAYAWFFATGATVVASVVFLRKVLVLPFAGTGKPFAAIAFASGSGAFAAAYLQHAISGWIGLIAGAAAAGALTVAVLWILNRTFELKLTSDLATAFPQTATLLARFEA